MARDDPKKPRRDIRDDGRPLPLKHQSARGEVPRNSGNFVRGSQLLNTQVLMWLQGIKMPLLLWLILFGMAYFLIVSLSLTEIHNPADSHESIVVGLDVGRRLPPAPRQSKDAGWLHPQYCNRLRSYVPAGACVAVEVPLMT